MAMTSQRTLGQLRMVWAWIGLVLLLGVASDAAAQGTPTLSLTSTSGPPQSEVAVSVELTHVDPVDGWQFGICHDATEVTPVRATASETVNTALNGGPADFVQIFVLTEGVQVGAIISLIGCCPLPAGTQDLLDVDYSVDSPVGVVSTISICSTVTAPGFPAVDVLISVGSQTIVPAVVDGTITSAFTRPTFAFALPSPVVDFNPATGIEQFTVTASIEEVAGSVGAINDAYGFSMALESEQEFIVPTAAMVGSGLQGLNGGAGPEFFSVNTFSSGVTVGVVFSLMSPVQTLTFSTATDVVEIEYTTNVNGLLGQLTPVTTTLDWQNRLGTPPISNTVVYSTAGDTSHVIPINGVVTLNPVDELFVRGDCTANGTYDIGDPIALLGTLFAGGGALPCEDACDGNDDGALNVADAVYLLLHLFSNGTPPPAPYPSCSADATADPLDCGNFGSC